MYLIRPPRVYRWLFHEALFRKDPEEKKVYLTFDDGPHAEATPFVLDTLRQHSIKATFFMLGKNVRELPGMADRVKEEGHAVGNHGMAHLNGWATAQQTYMADCMEGREMTGSGLFRPPYGRITVRQYRELKQVHELVFWDVIAGDFDPGTDIPTVICNVLENTRNGSIIVMHDSLKAMNSLKGSLNGIISGLRQKGFEFGILQIT